MDVAEIEKLVKVMRRHGVRVVQSAGLRVEMQPRRPRVVEVQATEQAPWGGEEKCVCGHPVDAHSEHGCLLGPCDPATCQATGG